MSYQIFEKLCKDRNVTPYRVSKETGISTATLSSWKAGRYEIKQDKLKKIADYFGVPIEYLKTGEINEGYYVDSDTASLAKQIYESKELSMLFDIQRNMSADDLQTLYQMALALKRKEQPE